MAAAYAPPTVVHPAGGIGLGHPAASNATTSHHPPVKDSSGSNTTNSSGFKVYGSLFKVDARYQFLNALGKGSYGIVWCVLSVASDVLLGAWLSCLTSHLSLSGLPPAQRGERSRDGNEPGDQEGGTHGQAHRGRQAHAPRGAAAPAARETSERTRLRSSLTFFSITELLDTDQPGGCASRPRSSQSTTCRRTSRTTSSTSSWTSWTRTCTA